MKRLALALLLLLGLAPSAQAQLSRPQLESVFQNTSNTPSGLGTQLLDILISAGIQTDTNTWTAANTFTGPVSFATAPTFPAAPPGIVSCGTGTPSVAAASSNAAGQFTLGTGTPTACTIQFATAYPTASFCTVTPASSGGAAISGGFYISMNDKTGFIITLGTGTSSLVFNYTCGGN